MPKFELIKKVEPTCIKAIASYGFEPQFDMIIEECSELIKALQKYRRFYRKYFPDMPLTYFPSEQILDEVRNAILEEFADVFLMLLQGESMFGLFDKQIEYKHNRLLEKLNFVNPFTTQEK